MSQELRDALNGLAARTASHPEPDELAAYHDGELPPERERRIQDHLVACRECAGLLLDLDGLADPGFGAGSGSSEKESVWRGLQEEIGKGATLAPVVSIRRAAYASPRWLQALAAALLVATLGLSAWVASLQRTIRELGRPIPNAAPLQLDAGSTRGEGGALSVTTVPSDLTYALLILTPHGERRDRYQAVIERANGNERKEVGRVWLE
ncbi:MAG TPA: zf-HC2 domain-containing protein, partial [Thermoanaerobaculia bacterium]